jgi:type IV pilus assembly protein PilN
MVRINLLPIREILKKRELKQFAVYSGTILIAAVAVMVLAYMVFSYKVSGLEKEKTVQQKKLAELKEKNKEIETLKAEITRLQKQVDTIQNLTKIRDTPAPFMAAISRALPDEVWLTSITKSGKSFTLEGLGLDNTVVVKFVENLQALKKGFFDRQFGTGSDKDGNLPFFTDVKLVQVVAATSGAARGGTPGLSTMNFKVVGQIR